MRIGLFWRVLPVQLAIAGLVAIPFWQRHEAKVEALSAGHLAQTQLTGAIKPTVRLIQGEPVRVLLPRLGIDVPVVNGVFYQTMKVWSVAPSSANYAPNTAEINNMHDSSLIYGHWTPQVFGPTKQLAPGDVVYVFTNNDHLFKYTYSGKMVVKPTDTQIFDQLKGKPGLVLMTCEGTWAQNRRLMFFNLETAK